jgi:hypothetical protein
VLAAVAAVLAAYRSHRNGVMAAARHDELKTMLEKRRT